MQTNAQNDKSTDLKLPMSGVGFLSHRQTDRGRQANTTTQNDKSTDLKLPMSGVGFLSHRQTQADRRTQLHRMTNQLI